MFKKALFVSIVGFSLNCFLHAGSVIEQENRPKWLKPKRCRPETKNHYKIWKNSRVNERGMQDSAEKLLYLIDKYEKSPTRPFYMYQLARHLLDLDDSVAAKVVLTAIQKLPVGTPYEWKYWLTDLGKLKREAAFMEIRADAQMGKKNDVEAKVKTLKPVNGYENLRIAESYTILGDYAKAKPYLEKSHGEGHPEQRFSDAFLRLYAATLARMSGDDELAMSIAEPILTSGSNAQRYPQWKAVYWILDRLKNNIKNDKGKEDSLDKLSKSGRFVGDARGFVGDLAVITTVTNKGFKKVNVSKNRENRPWSAITVVPDRISKRKSLAVDAVTGATITSCAIMVAADDSVNKASSASSSSSSKAGTSYRYNVNTGRTTVVKSQNDSSSRKSRISFK